MDDLFRRQEKPKEDFRYNYVDYDMSEVHTQRSFNDTASETSQFRDQWDYKSQAQFYTSKLTRNAQTVTHKERHRPIFQIYTDLIFAIFATTTLLLRYLLHLHSLSGAQVNNVAFGDSVIAKLLFASLFFVKFFVGVVWYRMSDDGNVPQQSKTIFWIRFLYDLLTYAFIYFVIFDKEDQSKNIYLYCLMATMLIKEIYLYVACVVRASKKINKEKFDKSLAAGFANLLKSAKTSLLNH